MVEHRRHAADAGSIPRCGKVPPPPHRINFQYKLSDSVRTLSFAIACIYICAHVKDPVVHVKVRWITETLKHPVCTVGWIARLCRSWLYPDKATRGEKSHRDNTVVKTTTTTTTNNNSKNTNTVSTDSNVASFTLYRAGQIKENPQVHDDSISRRGTAGSAIAVSCSSRSPHPHCPCN